MLGWTAVRRIWRAAGGLVFASAMLVAAPTAQASHGPVKRLADGVQRITYDVGPINVTPGQNRIAYRPISGPEKPAVNGWITRMKPDLVWADGPHKGKPPQSIKVMFHHGVWINQGANSNSPFGQLLRGHRGGEDDHGVPARATAFATRRATAGCSTT